MVGRNGFAWRAPEHDARVVTLAGPCAALTCVALYWLTPGWRAADGGWVAVVGVLVGLPHGAVDHLLPPSPGSARAAVGRVARYAAAVAAFLGLLAFAPSLGLALFVAVSVLHLGEADVSFHQWRRREPWRRDRWTALATVGYGGLPVFVPLWWWPEHTRRFLASVAPGAERLVGGTPPVATAWLTLTAVCVVAVRACRRGHPWLAAELGCLTALVFSLPPLPMFGVYFATWHALRHFRRALPALPGNDRSPLAEGMGRACARFARLALPGTLGAYLLLGALGALAATGAGGTVGHGGHLAALVAAVTLPHTLAVRQFDRVAGGAAPGAASAAAVGTVAP